MEVLKNVLIKESDGGKNGDKVVYVDNLPKYLVYRKVKKMMIDYTDSQNRQNLIPAFEVLDNGKKRFTGEMVDELLPGIEKSPTGDEALVFFTQQNESKQRLRDIDEYLRRTVPVSERLQERVYYALQPGVMSSGPIPLSAIPRIVLPELVSPPAQAVQASTHAAVSTAVPEQPKKRTRRPMTDEEKAAARARMARAREVRTAQQTGKI